MAARTSVAIFVLSFRSYLAEMIEKFGDMSIEYTVHGIPTARLCVVSQLINYVPLAPTNLIIQNAVGAKINSPFVPKPVLNTKRRSALTLALASMNPPAQMPLGRAPSMCSPSGKYIITFSSDRNSATGKESTNILIDTPGHCQVESRLTITSPVWGF